MSERVIRACDADVEVVPATAHVAITIDGESRELDLCAEHLSQLQEALSGLSTGQQPEPAEEPQSREPRTSRRNRRSAAPGRGAAASRGTESARASRRRSTGTRTRTRRPAAAAEQDGSAAVSQEAIRAWAREQGLDVKERGRLSGGIVSQYEAAHAAAADEPAAETTED